MLLDKRHSLPYSLIDSLYTRVCPVPIGPTVAEKLAHVCNIFFCIFSEIRSESIPRVKAMRKSKFFQLVPRAYLTPHQYRFLTVHCVHLCSRRCANFSRYSQTFGLHAPANDPFTQKVNRQADRQADRGSLLKWYSRQAVLACFAARNF